MSRKVFWKSRRALGTLVALVGLGLEASGFVPEGTLASMIANYTAYAGVVVAIWGGIQADTPLGLRG